MSVRKRKWKTGKGVVREAFVVDYTDRSGKRHIETFAKKGDADERWAEIKIEVKEGTHVARAASITVEEAGEKWIERAELVPLKRTTIVQYREHLRLHINPRIGNTKLADLNGPAVVVFEREMAKDGLSPALRKKVLTSLVSLLGEAMRSGYVNRNVARGVKITGGARKKRKLRVGTDIPTPDEIRAFISALNDRWRPLFITAVFTGMRISELRGLTWADVDLADSAIHVRQRADAYGDIAEPKSEAGERTIPVPPIVVNTLREWRLRCPNCELGLVFPSESGNVQSTSNIRRYGLIPTMKRAGVNVEIGEKDKSGKPIMAAKYTGFHALRHFYASMMINRVEDGGLGLPPKVVQERLGHANISMTMDTYGHLFPRGDDADELKAMERALIG